MSKNVTTQIFQFSALQWFFWSTWCTFSVFNVYHLGERGLSNAFIGTLVFTMTLAGIMGQYAWGYVCDRFRTLKKVFLLCMLSLTMVIVPFPLYLGSPWLLVIAFWTIGFLWSAQPPIIDTWTVETSPVLARSYGFTRAWGSVGFALLASVFGRLIEAYGWNVMFLSFGALAIVTMAIAMTIEDGSSSLRSNDQVPAKGWLLLGNLDYVFVVVASTIIFVPQQTMMYFLPVIIRNVGGTPADLGIATFASAMSEVPMLFLSVWFLRRFAPKGLLVSAAVLYLVRVGLMSIATTPAMVAYANALQGLSFGVFLPTIIYYVKQLAPEGLKTTAQTVAAGCYFGVGGMVASLIGGNVIDRYGVDVMLRGGMVMTALGVALFVHQYRRQSPQQESTIGNAASR